MIELEGLTKVYPGESLPAVNDVTLTVPEGEISIFIGPSGCGKTTLMRMINRLLPLTSGRILLGGRDVHEMDPIELRRGIGYVIQQIGLFPNMTVRGNIAVVPRLLGWPKNKIDERADELLAMVNLEPEVFRGRFPRELSGGQAQRIGVARAMAANPPVMLMDEPFGAIDPINRLILQDEFLKIQEKLKKTVIFVTHDIDEAVKMGGRICLMREGRVEQYGPVEKLLASPKNEFVESFVGADRTLKRLNLLEVREAMIKDPVFCLARDPAPEVFRRMEEKGLDFLLVVGEDERLEGYVGRRDLADRPGEVAAAVRPLALTVHPEENLREALSRMLGGGLGILAVIDAEGRLAGVLDPGALHRVVGQPDHERGGPWGKVVSGGRVL